MELSDVFLCEPAVADLDGDGQKEIIAGTADGKLWVIIANGSIKSGFPVQLNAAITGAPLVLENNRIVVGTGTRMYVVSPEGDILTERVIPVSMAGGAIPVDIIRDGVLEIVFVTSNGWLYACLQDGTDVWGFPVNLGGFFTCPPLAADIDGDDQYEIIAQSYSNTTHIIRRNGLSLSGFPFPLNYTGSTPATLLDFDNDGNLELVSGYSNGVLVIKLRRPVNNLMPWTVYRGSLSREGSFACTGFTGLEEQNTPLIRTSLQQNYPNPFNPSTTIRFSLAEKDANVQLNIYNLKGQKVRTLVKGALDKGNHQVVWNGTDDSGRKVAGGIYIYRLMSGKYSATRKMIMLK